MTKDQATREIAAHERCAASASDPGKAAQHRHSARYLREQFDIPALTAHPPYEQIVSELLTLGCNDCLQDFWRFHDGQAHPGVGQQEYQKAYLRLRKLAAFAGARHKRATVWVPVPVGYGEPMQFAQVTTGESFKRIEVQESE